MIYATPEEFRTYLPQAESANADDDLIQDVLERVTAIVANELGITFLDVESDWSAVSSKTVRSEDSVWLKLPAYQQGSITLLVRAGESTALTDWEERWEDGRSYLWRESGWQERRYTVTAVWGYGPPPPTVVEVTLEVAVNLWRGRDRGMFQEVQTGPGNAGGVTALRFIGGLTAQQRTILERERRKYRDGVY